MLSSLSLVFTKLYGQITPRRSTLHPDDGRLKMSGTCHHPHSLMTDSSKPFLLLQRRTQNLRQKQSGVLLTKHPLNNQPSKDGRRVSWSSPSADWAWRYPFHGPTCSGPWFPGHGLITPSRLWFRGSSRRGSVNSPTVAGDHATCDRPREYTTDRATGVRHNSSRFPARSGADADQEQIRQFLVTTEQVNFTHKLTTSPYTPLFGPLIVGSMTCTEMSSPAFSARIWSELVFSSRYKVSKTSHQFQRGLHHENCRRLQVKLSAGYRWPARDRKPFPAERRSMNAVRSNAAVRFRLPDVSDWSYRHRSWSRRGLANALERLQHQRS